MFFVYFLCPLGSSFGVSIYNIVLFIHKKNVAYDMPNFDASTFTYLLIIFKEKS